VLVCVEGFGLVYVVGTAGNQCALHSMLSRFVLI
jgi:hypothetical protein